MASGAGQPELPNGRFRSLRSNGCDHRTVPRIAPRFYVKGVGHRVVHGGTRFAAPIEVSNEIIAELEKLYVPAAPAAQPGSDQGDRSTHAANSTSRLLRHGLSPCPAASCATTFAIPREFSRSGIRRYGFHGLSYEYVSGRLQEIAPSCVKENHHRPPWQWRQPLRHPPRQKPCDHHGVHGSKKRPCMGRCGSLDPRSSSILWTNTALDARA